MINQYVPDDHHRMPVECIEQGLVIDKLLWIFRSEVFQQSLFRHCPVINAFHQQFHHNFGVFDTIYIHQLNFLGLSLLSHHYDLLETVQEVGNLGGVEIGCVGRSWVGDGDYGQDMRNAGLCSPSFYIHN